MPVVGHSLSSDLHLACFRLQSKSNIGTSIAVAEEYTAMDLDQGIKGWYQQ